MIAVMGSKVRKVGAVLCVALLSGWQVGFAQNQAGPAPPPAQAGAPLLTPDQLDNLVAPVALYPDPLLGEVLAASTYPLEIVEAQRWLQQNRNLQGAQLIDAVKQQNWDPSVQALVAFPDVLNLLNNDLQWTTSLGNAFLSQQADVMAAVQSMRARAQANGKLSSNAQETVTTQTQNDQSAIEIQPANPQVIYVPVYQPEYIWGPPAWGAYPDLWYPPGYGFGFGYAFMPGIYLGGFFPGWYGWGGWGWGCGWFGGGLYVNAGFFNRWGFAGRFGGGFGYGYGGRNAWVHDPGHRMGVAYPNRAVANRFNSSRFVGASRGAGQYGGTARNGFAGAGRGAAAGGVRPVDRGNVNGWGYGRGSATQNRGGSVQSYRGSTYGGRSYGSGQGSYSAPRGYSGQGSYGASRSYSAPSRSYSAPSRSYSAPSRSYSAPSRSYSAPSRSYSAPSRSYSAPSRSFSGGGGGGHMGGFSGGGGGGHSGGGGGHGRR